MQLPVKSRSQSSPSPSSDTGSERQPLLVPATDSSTLPPTSNTQDTKSHELDSSHFDLALAQISLVVDIASYVLLASVPTAVAFTLGTMGGSMGAGFNPAVQSVALGLYRRRGGTENGKLFGALSVVQALWWVFSFLSLLPVCPGVLQDCLSILALQFPDPGTHDIWPGLHEHRGYIPADYIYHVCSGSYGFVHAVGVCETAEGASRSWVRFGEESR